MENHSAAAEDESDIVLDLQNPSDYFGESFITGGERMSTTRTPATAARLESSGDAQAGPFASKFFQFPPQNESFSEEPTSDAKFLVKRMPDSTKI